jgi:hypothetical protein
MKRPTGQWTSVSSYEVGGMIQSSPQKVLARTNWRFFNELKEELKG